MTLNKMISAICASTVVAGCASVVPSGSPPQTQQPARPNFVTIVLDDLGYSDLRMFGGEMATPNLERLAADSVLLSNFYAAPSSSPSRAMLFTGKDSHAAGMGAMAEGIREEQVGKPNYETVMTFANPTFPELLQKGGYHTMMVGKWHLGGHRAGEEAYVPFRRGFSQTRAIVLPGGEMTFITGKKGEFISEHPSTHLFGGRKSLYNENGHDADMSKLPPLTIGENYYTDGALAMLDDWGGKSERPPFYLNMSYIAPHQPLQSPKEVIDSLVPVYAEGWDRIRTKRFENLKKLGLLPAQATLPPMPANVPAWDSLSARQKAFEARRMAVYAAEMKVLDDNIGRLVKRLQQLGAYENTVFLVYSDNGASNSSFGHMPAGFSHDEYTAEQLSKMTPTEFDKMMQGVGSAYSWLGPNTEWATVSGLPHRGFKGDTYDGGLVGAAFIHYPRVTKGAKYNDCLWSVMDIAPTVLEMAGVAYPTTYNGKPLAPMNGVSLSGLIKGEQACRPGRVLGFELDGLKGLRYGDWKLAQAWNDSKLHLFNVKDDPFERNDLAASNPAKVKELMALYAQYAKDNLVVEVNPQNLPNLADPKRTSAKIRGGASAEDADGLMFLYKSDAQFAKGATVNVAGEVRPEARHLGKAGKTYAEVIATTAQGRTEHYFVTPEGLIKGSAGAKIPFASYTRLPEMALLPIFEGRFADLLAKMSPEPVSLQVVLGYQVRGGAAIDNARHGAPMTLSVAR